MDFRRGEPVLITSKSQWTAFVDGWRGFYRGEEAGHHVVHCWDEEMWKRFLIPHGELVHTPHAPGPSAVALAAAGYDFLSEPVQ